MRKHAELIKQWAEDETAEVECLQTNGTWYPVALPSWSIDQTYRIKPKAKVEMWQWVLVGVCDSTNEMFATNHFYPNKEAAAKHSGEAHKVICKVEGSRIEVEE